MATAKFTAVVWLYTAQLSQRAGLEMKEWNDGAGEERPTSFPPGNRSKARNCKLGCMRVRRILDSVYPAVPKELWKDLSSATRGMKRATSS